MEKGSQDRRVRRTRNLIKAAFMDLILEKGYDAITVQDILDRADVGRSTFYAHFVDKEQLLMDQLDEFRESLLHQHNRQAVNHTKTPVLAFSLSMFQHAQSNYQHYQRMFTRNDTAFLHKHVQSILVEIVHNELITLKYDVRLPIQVEAIAQFMVNAYWGLLLWWLDHKMPYSVEEMDKMYQKLILSGINGMLHPSR